MAGLAFPLKIFQGRAKLPFQMLQDGTSQEELDQSLPIKFPWGKVFSSVRALPPHSCLPTQTPRSQLLLTRDRNLPELRCVRRA